MQFFVAVTFGHNSPCEYSADPRGTYLACYRRDATFKTRPKTASLAYLISALHRRNAFYTINHIFKTHKKPGWERKSQVIRGNWGIAWVEERYLSVDHNPSVFCAGDKGLHVVILFSLWDPILIGPLVAPRCVHNAKLIAEMPLKSETHNTHACARKHRKLQDVWCRYVENVKLNLFQCMKLGCFFLFLTI